MVEAPDHVQRLRKAADEMRRENQNGWSLTCDAAADEIESLQRQIAELRAENDRLDRELNVSQMQETIGIERFQAAEADNARLREALEPFGVENDIWDDVPDDTWLSINIGDMHVAHCTVGNLRAARAALSGSGTGGWKLVPVEPTAEMLNHPGVDAGERTMRKAWAAMLSAAPAAPTGEAK